jgi:hypothetical protein
MKSPAVKEVLDLSFNLFLILTGVNARKRCLLSELTDRCLCFNLILDSSNCQEVGSFEENRGWGDGWHTVAADGSWGSVTLARILF